MVGAVLAAGGAALVVPASPPVTQPAHDGVRVVRVSGHAVMLAEVWLPALDLDMRDPDFLTHTSSIPPLRA